MNPAPPENPGFALTQRQWPGGELELVLRRVALALLDDLLAPERNDLLSLERNVRPQLSGLCSADDFTALNWWWTEEPTLRLKTAFSLPPSIPGGVSLALSPHLLAPFWHLGAVRAWADLEFHQTVADRLGAWALRRWVVLPAEYAAPNVSPRTWALLLCLADAGESPPRVAWWSKLWQILLVWLRIRARPIPPPDLAFVWDRAQGLMAAAVLQKHWAGFWDQWLIRRALTQWPAAGREMSVEFRTACARIPWGNTAEPTETEFVPLARRDWERERPLFMVRPPLTLAD